MYPYQRTPMGNPYISPIYPYIVGVYGYTQLSLEWSFSFWFDEKFARPQKGLPSTVPSFWGGGALAVLGSGSSPPRVHVLDSSMTSSADFRKRNGEVLWTPLVTLTLG